ncbi:hypothetical protein NJC08_27390 [Pseudomonas fluorescens]|jgi:hypothetical protein|uniref:hypothetical protein n=1 Tax=Pseudomonas fluorescens TaxID=294 RepID=UPI00209ACD7D|nr:hypothetical protein [Pseudomonas fluorescens]MCO7630154.1 hypothetical protein [Pseudomonas fluorescens]
MSAHKRISGGLLACTALMTLVGYSVSAVALENTYLCTYQPKRAGYSHVSDISFVTTASSQDEALKKLSSDFYALYGPASSNGMGVFFVVSQSCVPTSEKVDGIRVVP